MKKIRSFFAALLMLAVMVGGVHVFCTGRSLRMDPQTFGLWYNTYKDLSYNALSQNMDPDTILVMGSSEFRHGLKTPYHPGNLFRNRKISLMTIGGPYNQTLFHTIALGSLQPQLKSKKVVLLISPTWFKKKGVAKNDYALRFSETEYIAFMENKAIPKETKEYVAKRSEKLLSKDQRFCGKVKLVNKVQLRHSKDFVSRTAYAALKGYATDKDYTTSRLAMRFMMKGPDAAREKTKPHALVQDALEWDNLAKNARKVSEGHSSNPFYMSDKVWKNKFSKIYKSFKGSHAKDSYETSPEYADLEAFLQICRANGIQAKLVVLPVNGRWYDHTGMTAEKRAVVSKKVTALGTEYGAEVTSLSCFDYEKYITLDAVHPWNEGWVKINEQIEKFYRKR